MISNQEKNKKKKRNLLIDRVAKKMSNYAR